MDAVVFSVESVELAGEVATMSLVDVHDALRRLQRLRTQIDAAMVSLIGRRGELLGLGDSVGRGLVSEVGIAARDAKLLGLTSLGLRSLPACAHDAFTEGQITADHVRALSGAGADLDAATQSALVEEGRSMGADAFRRRVIEVAVRDDGDDGGARRRRQHSERDGSIGADDEGMTRLSARVAPDEGSIVRNAIGRALDELWRLEHPDLAPSVSDRPAFGSRIADALVHLCRRFLDPSPGARTRAVPLITVSTSFETLAGRVRSQETGRPSSGGAAGRDSWGHALSPETVRRLACEADIIPMVLGGDSVPLDVGRSRRFPSVGQRMAVTERDRHCRFPGCDAPSAWCDVHHVVHWARFGPTDVHNLVLLCSRHHHAVHEGGWRMHGDANGEIEVRFPDGPFAGRSRPPGARARELAA